MLHTINLNEYNLNNCKFIVIKNYTDENFIFNKIIIKPNQEIFKKFSNEILSLETEYNINIKTLGFVILINIYNEVIKTKDFLVSCGGIKPLYKNKNVSELEIYIDNKFIITQFSTIIDMMELHYKYYNIYDQEISIINYIPLNIHFIWLKKNNDSKFELGYYKTWLNNHPKHKIYIWTNFDIIPEELLNNDKIIIKYQADILKLFKKYKNDFDNAINTYFTIKLLGGKSDILRYLILYDMGGLYVDINDFECFKSTEQLFYQYEFVVGSETSFAETDDLIYINNAFIMSKKEHIIIKRLLTNINPNNDKINYNDIWYDQDDSLANITGVCVFRNIILGYLLDPTIKDKTKYIVLPSIFLYPSCFYTEHNYHKINYKNDKDKWLHNESFATHYSQRSYLLE
jgi:mannosyltransferase OCH1-like enzyme